MAHTKSSERESKKSGTVQVHNHTSRSLGVGLTNRKAGTVGTGPSAFIVSFLPGNNEIDAELWARCKEHPHVKKWMSRLVHLDRVGKSHKMTFLEEGLYDPDFASDTEDLGRRMHELRAQQKVMRA